MRKDETMEEYMARALGMSVKTVRRSVKRLEKLGVIQIDKTDGQNVYTPITRPGSTLHRWKLEHAKSVMSKDEYALYEQKQQNKHVTMGEVDE